MRNQFVLSVSYSDHLVNWKEGSTMVSLGLFVTTILLQTVYGKKKPDHLSVTLIIPSKEPHFCKIGQLFYLGNHSVKSMDYTRDKDSQSIFQM